jgi:crossover junction endodeoxyribonuclease RuvC
MRVLGIDPGLTRCGVGIVDSAPGRVVKLVHVGVIRSATDLPLEKRLALIHFELSDLISRFAPDAVAIERVFAQANVRTVMGTAQVSGLGLLLAAQMDIPVQTYTPSEVKAAVSGNGRADKNQVTTMVTRILNLDVAPKPADAADALAIAICHSWRGTSMQRIAQAAQRINND